MQKLKAALEARLSYIVLALIVIQPPLDVLSYFLSLRENNTPSTLLRFGLLALVALLGFLLSERKRIYLILYGVTAAYWLAHVANCYRIGYTSVVADTGNLLRTMNFPILALTFITILRKDPSLRKWLYTGTAIAFGEIILFTAIPWLSGNPVYTYYDIEVGVLGWFAVPSAQSAIILLSVPLAMYWAYHTGRYWVFLLTSLLCFGLMYATGTKMAFYSIFIIVAAYIFLFTLQLGRKSVKYALPLLALAVLVLVFRHQSPMSVREQLSAQSQAYYGEMMEDSLENSGADDSVRQIIRGESSTKEEKKLVNPPEKQLERVHRALMGIYANNGVYHFMTMNLNTRFGVYNTMDIYNYTDIPSVLSNTRERKLNFSRMMWKEKDTLTHFLGFEYRDFYFGILIHDLENDFPSIFYSNGYIGLALYLSFLGVFFFWVLRGLAGDMSRSLGAREGEGKKGRFKARMLGLWEGLRRFMTVELGAAGMSFLLAIIAAQISGNVLRRPNVTIYFAIAAAAVYSLTAEKEGPKWLRGKGRRKAK